MCCQVSYQGEYYNEWCQNMCFSLVIVLVIEYYHDYHEERFLQCVHSFCVMLSGCTIFRLLYFDLYLQLQILIFLFSCQNFFRTELVFLKIGYKKVDLSFIISFQRKFEKALNFFRFRVYFYNDLGSIFFIWMSFIIKKYGFYK